MDFLKKKNKFLKKKGRITLVLFAKKSILLDFKVWMNKGLPFFFKKVKKKKQESIFNDARGFAKYCLEEIPDQLSD